MSCRGAFGYNEQTTLSLLTRRLLMIDSWTCRADRPLQPSDFLSLTHLYQPLVGPNAIALYITLSNQLYYVQTKEHCHLQSNRLLKKLLSFSEEELIQSRYLLEGIGLLNTYEITDEENRQYIEYELIPPLYPKKFFQSDVLCMALYHQLGKEKFIALREELLPASHHSTKRRVDITKSYQEVFDSISPQEMAQYAKLEEEDLGAVHAIEESHSEGKYPKWNHHDLTAVRLQMGSLIKDEEWTKELEEELSEIKYLYQLDDWGLAKALQNPAVTRQGKVDTAALKKFVREEFQHRFGFHHKRLEPLGSYEEAKDHSKVAFSTEEEKHFQQLAQISPIELLSFYQGGSRIPDSDLELVESLVHDYELPYGVINVLLEYVLLKYNYKLPRALVEKIAGHWKRLRIKTVEEAFVQAKKENWNMRKKSKEKGRQDKRNHRSQPIPQAVVEQMKQEKVVNKKESHPDWMERQARINEKLALWERRKKKV